MSIWRMGPFTVVLLCLLALIVGAAATDSPSSSNASVPVQSSSESTASAAGGPMLDSASHRLAAGDYLLINFFDGKTAAEYRVQVDAAGEINLPLINSVNVGGLIPRAAADLLMQAYTVFYRQPQATVQVLDYGKIEIFVFGPDFPGEVFKLNNGARLTDLLRDIHLGQDYVQQGAYRQLHLVRGGFDFGALTAPQPLAVTAPAAPNTLATPSPSAVSHSKGSLTGFQNWRPWIEQRMHDPASQVWVVDPLQITVEGELSRYNVVLQDKDALFIPTPERFVELYGVANQGRYELLGQETLGDMLRLAGSVNYRSDLPNAVVERRDDCGRLQRLIFNIYPALDDMSCIENFELQNRDRISFVAPEQRIFVLGEVKLAGAFNFAEDSTVLDYLSQAGGETTDANMSWIAIIRQDRDRLDPQAPASVTQVNFKDIAKGRELAGNYFVIPGDVIYVPPKGVEFNTAEVMQATSTLVTSFAVVNNLTKHSSSN
jgi:protein involved in polysaccharide export with SLBB domain